MIISRNDEEKRSRIWRVTTLVSSVLIVLIAVYLLTKLFTTNPLEGDWEDEDGSFVMTIESNGTMSVNILEPEEVKKVDVIDKYGYYLEEDATDYYKSLYKELKDITNKDEVDYEEYAKIVAKLFVTDVFTLDNKVTSSDIGGLQFIYPDFREDFIKIK